MLLLIAVLGFTLPARAQQPVPDTFFLLKKKGLLKKLGQSIYRNPGPDNPVKSVNPFLIHRGKVIRSVSIAPTGFNKIPKENPSKLKAFQMQVTDAVHKDTRTRVIRKNLLFRAGDTVKPMLLADNEMMLRNLPFLRDALIVLYPDSISGELDAVVITRDVFSIGGNVSTLTPERARLSVRDENIFGSGNEFGISSYVDKERVPAWAPGAWLTLCNVKGSFVDVNTGFRSFNTAFSSGRRSENNYYFSLGRPLRTRFDLWTAAATVSYRATDNVYPQDTVYFTDYRYKIFTVDGWGGINLFRKGGYVESEKRLRHFIGIHGFYNKFYDVPSKVASYYDPNYADINAALTSYTLYRQNFYKSNFIYGFGRAEDVPKGISATVTGGYTNKAGVRRPYYGFEIEGTHYSEKGMFADLKLRTGAFSENNVLRDKQFVASADYFSRLHKLSKHWYQRTFMALSYTGQYGTHLNGPLFLQSSFGIPYFQGFPFGSDRRATFRAESVFYGTRDFLGFRFAPFCFADHTLLRPLVTGNRYTQGFTAIGGGLRTRNENLTFGTVELRAYYFPKTYEGRSNWMFDVGTNIRFRYNRALVKPPGLVQVN